MPSPDPQSASGSYTFRHDNKWVRIERNHVEPVPPPPTPPPPYDSIQVAVREDHEEQYTYLNPNSNKARKLKDQFAAAVMRGKYN